MKLSDVKIQTNAAGEIVLTVGKESVSVTTEAMEALVRHLLHGQPPMTPGNGIDVDFRVDSQRWRVGVMRRT